MSWETSSCIFLKIFQNPKESRSISNFKNLINQFKIIISSMWNIFKQCIYFSIQRCTHTMYGKNWQINTSSIAQIKFHLMNNPSLPTTFALNHWSTISGHTMIEKSLLFSGLRPIFVTKIQTISVVCEKVLVI